MNMLAAQMLTPSRNIYTPNPSIFNNEINLGQVTYPTSPIFQFNSNNLSPTFFDLQQAQFFFPQLFYAPYANGIEIPQLHNVSQLSIDSAIFTPMEINNSNLISDFTEKENKRKRKNSHNETSHIEIMKNEIKNPERSDLINEGEKEFTKKIYEEPESDRIFYRCNSSSKSSNVFILIDLSRFEQPAKKELPKKPTTPTKTFQENRFKTKLPAVSKRTNQEKKPVTTSKNSLKTSNNPVEKSISSPTKQRGNPPKKMITQQKKPDEKHVEKSISSVTKQRDNSPKKFILQPFKKDEKSAEKSNSLATKKQNCLPISRPFKNTGNSVKKSISSPTTTKPHPPTKPQDNIGKNVSTKRNTSTQSVHEKNSSQSKKIINNSTQKRTILLTNPPKKKPAMIKKPKLDVPTGSKGPAKPTTNSLKPLEKPHQAKQVSENCQYTETEKLFRNNFFSFIDRFYT